jgi:hypothetical protein
MAGREMTSRPAHDNDGKSVGEEEEPVRVRISCGGVSPFAAMDFLCFHVSCLLC